MSAKKTEKQRNATAPQTLPHLTTIITVIMPKENTFFKTLESDFIFSPPTPTHKKDVLINRTNDKSPRQSSWCS